MQKIEGCNVETAKSTEEIIGNIKKNAVILCLEITSSLHWRDGKPIAIVGGGPSLKETWKELLDYNDVMVAGSPHDYIIEKGIKPRFCVVCDPDEIMVNYLQKPWVGTSYLLASQCNPIVFEHLKEYPRYIWHAAGNKFDISEFEGKIALGGGCTVGTRAICIALGMGFNNIHLYGFDTCLDKDFKHHAYEFIDEEKETIGNISEIRLGEPTGKKFYVAGYHLGQLFDFQSMLKIYSDRMQITVHGDGLLKELMDLAKKEALK